MALVEMTTEFVASELTTVGGDGNTEPFSRSRKPKPIPPPLNIVADLDTTDRLTEFAIFATSPRSPLMQKNLPLRKRAYSCSSIHSYAHIPQSPPSSILSPPASQISQPSPHGSLDELDSTDAHVTSSSPFPASPTKSPSCCGMWSHQWPKFVWHCFVVGTKVKLVDGPDQDWHLAEELAFKETLTLQAELQDSQQPKLHYFHFSAKGLKFVRSEKVAGEELLELEFCNYSENGENAVNVLVRCSLDHPFFVRDKGWSSFCPELTVMHYGIPCRDVCANDICLPPHHAEATLTADVFENFKSFDLTPEDTTAVFTLSSMAKHKNELLSNTMSPPVSPTKRSTDRHASDSNRPKRPMNGFMLFAKKFRMEYTHMNPGKDNRAISVLLGDTWKKMKTEERNRYAEQARILAEEQKKLHPDCWKRKRSLSSS